MNRLIASLAAAVSLVPGAQALSPLGADAASFDQLLENAYLRRDVAFVEAAVIDDVTFAADPDPKAKAWTKRELVNAVRFFDGIARNVDAVHVPGVLRSADGASLPQLLREVKPRYTGEAMRAQIEGTVLLEVVVNTDGTVGDVFVFDRSTAPTASTNRRSRPPGGGSSCRACATASPCRFSSRCR